MLLAEGALSWFGIVFGFVLWCGLFYAVHRWGPLEDEASLKQALRTLKKRLR
jgi:hypothetical protein